jgi:hypothetical protein
MLTTRLDHEGEVPGHGRLDAESQGHDRKRHGPSTLRRHAADGGAEHHCDGQLGVDGGKTFFYSSQAAGLIKLDCLLLESSCSFCVILGENFEKSLYF